MIVRKFDHRSFRLVMILAVAALVFAVSALLSFAASVPSLKASGNINSPEGAIVRKGATRASKIVTVLDDNTPVTITGEVFVTKNKTAAVKKWYSVTAGKYKGYIRSDLIKNIKYDTKTAKGKTTAKICYRVGAGTAMKSKGKFKKGKTLTIVLTASAKGSKVKWYKIKYGSKYYYVCSNRVKVTVKKQTAKKTGSNTNTNTNTNTNNTNSNSNTNTNTNSNTNTDGSTGSDTNGTTGTDGSSGTDATTTVQTPKKTDTEIALETKQSAYAKKVADKACKWAVKIANDNDFHYGNGEHSKHNGCYFCGTQPKSKQKYVVQWEKTYCCNPFVTAAFAHGGNEPFMLDLCKRCKSYMAPEFKKSALFANLGHPDQSALQRGDILCASNHVALYLGNGKLVEAAVRDDGVPGSSSWNSSIRVCKLTAKRWKGFNAGAYRYIGETGSKSK